MRSLLGWRGDSLGWPESIHEVKSRRSSLSYRGSSWNPQPGKLGARSAANFLPIFPFMWNLLLFWRFVVSRNLTSDPRWYCRGAILLDIDQRLPQS
ncbi:hypothetical protein BDV59DRAFT_171332 [Aspergillus ambiguus]|uniref:uncharacterized protein n=1 Tax=Aspergillus ambiguus TaxID=176160 RepID=UPI003CCCF19A